MALKRKRSTPFISSPVSDISTTTTGSSDETAAIPFFYQQQKPISPLPLQRQKPTWSWPTYDDTPSTQLLNSRTRKRHRDDRPDEQQIHAPIRCATKASRSESNPVTSKHHSDYAPATPIATTEQYTPQLLAITADFDMRIPTDADGKSWSPTHERVITMRGLRPQSEDGRCDGYR
ncbi:hypothetical protein D0869_03642 [Hortaea werneckii]|uniref:Uncharacterized protein n=1 Tax=Hortaea werneckii TaxID=91943 RepID=A0A3M6X4Q2_HORWE|nr:hypothetical protein D0869_03642 [Hortaea werneckii]RMY18785.1 hypothetical protein D0867_05093 [Hortaea werneckii]